MQPFCRGKAINITYSECVYIALGINIECALALLSFVAYQVLQYFSTLSHKRQHFFGEGGRLLNLKLCFDFLYKFCLKYFPF